MNKLTEREYLISVLRDEQVDGGWERNVVKVPVSAHVFTYEGVLIGLRVVKERALFDDTTIKRFVILDHVATGCTLSKNCDGPGRLRNPEKILETYVLPHLKEIAYKLAKLPEVVKNYEVINDV